MRPVIPGCIGEWRQTAPSTGVFDVTLSSSAAAATVPGPIGLHSATAQVYGTAFNDLDGDGARDANEPGLGRQKLYIDLNNNGFFDTDDTDGFVIEEPHTFTDSYGNFYFFHQDPGTLRIRHAPPFDGGVRVTSPASNVHTVSVPSGGVATGLLFGLELDDSVPPPPPPPPPPVPPNTISGVVFEDADGDGTRDDGEKGIGDVRVFRDENGNGKWDEATDLEGADERWIMTDRDGSYRLNDFGGLDPGTYRLGVSLPSGWSQTSPASGFQHVVLTAGQTITGKDFGVRKAPPPPPPPPPLAGEISGVCFDDRDGDGAKDANEPGLADWNVYVDTDKDGKWDEGEPSTWTTAAGTFTFAAMAFGTYTVREVNQEGWQQTSPSAAGLTVSLRAGRSVRKLRLGNSQDATISGTVYHDANGSGGQGSGEKGLSGWRVWLDADNDGKRDSGERSVLTDSSGNYRFADLPAGTHRVRVAAPSGWRRTAPSSDTHKVKLTGGAAVAGKTFGFTRLALISGTVFNDRDGDKKRDSGEAGLAGWRVFLDNDNNGRLDKGEKSVLTNDKGEFKFRDVPAGTHRVRVVQQAGWRATTPSGAHTLTLAAGTSSTTNLFGQRRI